jgi:hypothetical protein
MIHERIDSYDKQNGRMRAWRNLKISSSDINRLIVHLQHKENAVALVVFEAAILRWAVT